MYTLPLSSMKAKAVAVPGKDPWTADLHDSALTVMTDFREHASVTVSESATIDGALDHMKHTGVRSAFVTDDQTRLVTGLITAYDIGSEKPMLHMRLQSIPRREVLVRDVMQPITAWRVANIEDVESATVAAVSHMFAVSGLTHVPVVETGPGGGQRLRGMLSAARIKRVLARFETGADIAPQALPLGGSALRL